MTEINFRRGTAAEWLDSNPTLTDGEPGYEVDTGHLKIGNGSQQWVDLPYFMLNSVLTEEAQDAVAALFANGTHNGITFTYNDELGKLEATVTGQFSDEQAQDAMAALLVGSTHSGISFVYDDANNKLIATVSTAVFTAEEAQDAAAAALTSGTHSGISFAYDDAGNKINATVTFPTPYTDEMAQDAIANLLAAGTHTGITFTYDDATNKLNAVVTVTGGGSGNTLFRGTWVAAAPSETVTGMVASGTWNTYSGSYNDWIDNNSSTVWIGRENNVDNYIQFDMGSVKTIASVEFDSTDVNAELNEAIIKVSTDNVNYTVAGTTNSRTPVAPSTSLHAKWTGNVSARYIRIYPTKGSSAWTGNNNLVVKTAAVGSVPYALDEHVVRNGVLYRCAVVNTTQVPGTGTDWVAVISPGTGGSGNTLFRGKWSGSNDQVISPGVIVASGDWPTNSGSFANISDGNSATTWVGTGPSGADKYVGFDLGSVRNLSVIEMDVGQSGSLEISTLKISTDGTTWTTLATLYAGGSPVAPSTAYHAKWVGTASARYVRFHPQGSSGAWTGPINNFSARELTGAAPYAIGEFVVYNGVLYRCAVGGTTQTPGSGSDWVAETSAGLSYNTALRTDGTTYIKGTVIRDAATSTTWVALKDTAVAPSFVSDYTQLFATDPTTAPSSPWTKTVEVDRSGVYTFNSNLSDFNIGPAPRGVTTGFRISCNSDGIHGLRYTYTQSSAGVITFDDAASSEGGFDKGSFWIDGVKQHEVSGTGNNWATRNYNISAGAHTLEWKYSRDGSGAAGQNAYGVANLVISNASGNSDWAALSHTPTAAPNPYTDEKAQDAIAAMFAAGTHTGGTFTYDDANNKMSFAATGGGGVGGGALKVAQYNPTTQASYSTSNTTPTDVDATNLAVTFTAPASGKVLVVLDALAGTAGHDSTTHWWSLRNGSTVVGQPVPVTSYGAPTPDARRSAQILVTGLTPGASVTLKWAYHVTTAASTGTAKVYAGGTGVGPVTMSVFDAESSGSGGSSAGTASLDTDFQHDFIYQQVAQRSPREQAVTGTWGADANQLYNTTNAQNDAYAMWLFLDPGTYTLSLTAQADVNRAIQTWELELDDGSWQAMGTLDWYATGTNNFLTKTLSFTVPAGQKAARRRIRAKAATRNASATGWYISFTRMNVYKTSALATASGSGGWEQVLSITGSEASLVAAGLTPASGTWAIANGYIEQTDNSSNIRRLRVDKKLPLGATVIYEAEVMMVPGTGNGGDQRLALVIGFDGVNNAGVAVRILGDGTNYTKTEVEVDAALARVSKTGITGAYGTWKKVRAVTTGNFVSVYVDGILLFTAGNNVGQSADSTYVGILNAQVVARFRNIKAWTPVLPS